MGVFTAQKILAGIALSMLNRFVETLDPKTPTAQFCAVGVFKCDHLKSIIVSFCLTISRIEVLFR
jgi:hypothetical protein